jgi:hypothetical protein
LSIFIRTITIIILLSSLANAKMPYTITVFDNAKSYTALNENFNYIDIQFNILNNKLNLITSNVWLTGTANTDIIGNGYNLTGFNNISGNTINTSNFVVTSSTQSGKTAIDQYLPIYINGELKYIKLYE